MSQRDARPINSTPDPYGQGFRQTHPAFGTVIVTRSSGGSGVLFQSDLRHRETITLRIDTAERVRDLHHDWLHPRETLVEVEMSLAQWGALVSSIGIGSGVPVTIRRTENLNPVPELPFEPRIRANLAEVDGKIDQLTEQVRHRLEVVTEAFEQKRGVRAMRAALADLRASVANMKSNSRFAVDSLAEAAETVTAQAKADLEAHVLAAIRATGVRAPIDVPGFDQEPATPQAISEGTES